MQAIKHVKAISVNEALVKPNDTVDLHVGEDGQVERVISKDKSTGEVIMYHVLKDGCGKPRPLSDAVRDEWRARMAKPTPPNPCSFMDSRLNESERNLRESELILLKDMFARNRVAMYPESRATVPPMSRKKKSKMNKLRSVFM